MTVETSVCAIRPFAQGKSVGYGCTWTAQEDTDIAVLPVGYEDGWFRRFSKEGIKVACADNILLIKKVQFPNGKPLEVKPYINGNSIEENTILK